MAPEPLHPAGREHPMTTASRLFDCHNGLRSERAMQLLEHQGLDQVYTLCALERRPEVS